VPGLPEPILRSSARTSGARSTGLLQLMLTKGGDPRISPDPVTRRNAYGAGTVPAPGEISFASTTANTISVPGFAAAGRALDLLLTAAPSSTSNLTQWFDGIRASIASFLGVPGSETILAASGTDAELLALGLVAAVSKRPLTNILIAPEETGSGVPLAASGQHFSNYTALGASVAQGRAIEGLASHEIEVECVAIRDPHGAPREAEAIDSDAGEAVERALRRGRDVLLHVLDTSKTGLTGLNREAARALAAAAPGRVRVVIDACQLRSGLMQVKRDLDDGFIVLATGSKFAGGPPFSGVVLLPASLAGEIAAEAAFARGLGEYSAALDWPRSLRNRFGDTWVSHTNIGPGLRWAAALDGIAAMAGVSEDLQARIAHRFANEVSAGARALKEVALCDSSGGSFASRTIVPLTILNRDGSFASLTAAREVQAALRKPGCGPICHVGQAVRLGARTVLRIAASAYTIAGVAARMSAGASLDLAFRPVQYDLERLFEKWSSIETPA